jgi:DNA polymerase III subunit gamma/tau
MSLDTKYRPISFEDVLGQDSSKAVLKSYITSGAGFHQSYLLAGPWGSGKTTLGRILARALLCDNPKQGDPCNQCDSCRDILEKGYSENFVEVDAATNSGKADMLRIKEALEYQSFSGKRKLYLLDEAHALSKDGLDSILKDLEDNIPGSKDKRLVCIFCTTELEKMRPAVKSRCAPVFQVQPLEPSVVADRLAFVCDSEGFKYERDALILIAEATEVHIRDALKALEAVSLVGDITLANVRKYFNLDVASIYLDILLNLEQDLPFVINKANDLVKTVSPAVVYQKLAEASMFAYHLYLGSAKPYIYWDLDKLKKLSLKQDLLLTYASTLTLKPYKPSLATLILDLSVLSKFQKGFISPSISNINVTPDTSVKVETSIPLPTEVKRPYVVIENNIPLVNDCNIHQLYGSSSKDPMNPILAMGVKANQNNISPSKLDTTVPDLPQEQKPLIRVEEYRQPLISDSKIQFSNSQGLLDPEDFVGELTKFFKELEDGSKR